MTRAESLLQLRQALMGLVALVVCAFAATLLVLGVVLLAAGILTWLHPVDVASAWARTLAGIGLIGCSATFAALGWLALRGMARREIVMNRKLKFAGVLGTLLALICLPLAAAIGATAHGSWSGWAYDSGDSGRMVARS